MSKVNDLSKVKDKLIERKIELEKELAELSISSQDQGQIQDPADLAQSLSMENLNISLQDNELV